MNIITGFGKMIANQMRETIQCILVIPWRHNRVNLITGMAFY
jgi:hypothetical protein